MPGTFCVWCRNEIPEDRERRRSVTCSDLCKVRIVAHRREKKDFKVCRHCNRPSTPEERVLYQRWRRETFPVPKKGRPVGAKSKKNRSADLQPEQEANDERKGSN